MIGDLFFYRKGGHAPRGFCIVTQDGDFAERSRLYGSPPKVIWLRCGNTPDQPIKLEVKQQLLNSLGRTKAGERGIPAEEVARKLGLSWQ